MNEADKRQSLLRLHERIARELSSKGRQVSFWLAKAAVKGWDGTQDIFFVSLNPSADGPGFPTIPDTLLYDELQSNGFTNAHITNAINVPSKRDEVSQLLTDKSLMAQSRSYFLEEIAILRPRLIVAMSRDAEKILRKWLSNQIPIQYIHNYAWATRWGHEDEFSRDLRDVHREYEKHRPTT